MSPFLFGYDFYYHWATGRVLQKGGNPYDLQQLNQQLAAINWPADEVAQGLTHPPTNLWLYWLIGKLPFEVSMGVVMLGSLVVALTCSVVLGRFLTTKQVLPRHFVLFVALIFPPVLNNLIWGQNNVVLLLGLTLFSLFFRRERLFLAGLSLSLLLFKPQNFAPFLFVVVLWELLHLRMRIVCGLVSGLLLQALATYLISPYAFVWYTEYVPTIVAESNRICGCTPGQMMQCELGWQAVRPMLLCIGTVVGVLLTRRAGYSLHTLLCLLVPLSLLVSPYAWSHTFIILIPAFLCALEPFVMRHGERRVSMFLTAVCLLSIPLMTNARIQYVWIAIPLIIFGLNLREAKRSSRHSDCT